MSRTANTTAPSYRWKCQGTMGEHTNYRSITAYVTATDRDGAVDAAMDSMGIVALCSVSKVSSKPLAQ